MIIYGNRLRRLSIKTIRKMLRIDIGKVLADRAPGVARLIPRFMVRWLEQFICQDRLNDLLYRGDGLEGCDFADSVLENLGISYKVAGRTETPERRVIFASNHPLGGLDGLVLCSMVRRLYDNPRMKFIVNDLLTYVEPMRPVFLGVNKHGAQNKKAAEAIDRAFDSDDPIIMFPAGLCSRRGDDGTIRDTAWNKMIINKAISSQRDIIPLHFSGENSTFFYKFARLRKRLGIRFNLEMVRLPRELVLNEGARFTVTIGEAVSFNTLTGGRQALAEAARLREKVYSLQGN